jgi:transposase
MIDYGALAGRAHGRRPTVPIVLSADELARIEAAMRPAKVEQRVVRRAQALLMMADGVPGTDIARLLGVDVATVQKWRRRFDCDNPVETLADAPRSGRPPSLSDAVAARVEAEACRPPSDVGLPVTQWSARLLGEHVRLQGIEISDRSVSRILQDADLQPHRQQMYLTSHPKGFAAGFSMKIGCGGRESGLRSC